MTGVFGDASGSQGFARRTALAGIHLNPELRRSPPTNIPDRYNDIAPGFHSTGTLRDCLGICAFNPAVCSKEHPRPTLIWKNTSPSIDSIQIPSRSQSGSAISAALTSERHSARPTSSQAGGFLWFPSLRACFRENQSTVLRMPCTTRDNQTPYQIDSPSQNSKAVAIHQ